MGTNTIIGVVPIARVRAAADRARPGGMGIELLEDVPDLQRLIVPVGGGGLISGVASAVKALKPDVEVIGVQSDGYALWPKAFEAGGRVSVTPQTIADGTTGPFTPKMFGLL